MGCVVLYSLHYLVFPSLSKVWNVYQRTVKKGLWLINQECAFLEVPVQDNMTSTEVTWLLPVKHSIVLKALDTFGNCWRPVFSLIEYPNICIRTITNLWKFGLDWSSKFQENLNERKKHPSCKNLCAFRCLKKKASGLIFYSRVILSTALHCSLPSKFLR